MISVPALFAAALGLGLAVALGVSRHRFRAAWRELAPRYAGADLPPVSVLTSRFRNVYCEAHVAGRVAGGPGFTVEATAAGLTLHPAPWHRPLPPVSIPWMMIATSRPATRTVGRLLAPCLRIQTTQIGDWFLVDAPAANSLYRYWREWTRRP